MKLYIRYHGQNLELETEQNGSVDDIQSEIYRLTGIEPYKQKISFLSSGNQVVIPQSSKFSFYNIKDQSLLFLDEMHEELENPQSPDIKITRRYSHRIPEVSPIYSEKNTHRKMSCYDVNETKGIEEWVAKIVICSREGNLDSFLETLQEYQNWKGMRLREEDVGDLLNWHYNQQ